jgi:cytochrome c oxidase subunit 2
VYTFVTNSLYGKTLLAQGASSVQGEKVDQMLWITLTITGIVFVVTQILLFWFAYKYQENENRKAFFFAHSTKLELIWTAIPAITLTVLVIFAFKKLVLLYRRTSKRCNGSRSNR